MSAPRLGSRLGLLAAIWLGALLMLVGARDLPIGLKGTPPVYTVAELADRDAATLPGCLSIRDGFVIDDKSVIQSIGLERPADLWQYFAVIPAGHPDVRRFLEADATPKEKTLGAPGGILTHALADCRLLWMVRIADYRDGKVTWPNPPGSLLTGVIRKPPPEILEYFIRRSPVLATKNVILIKAPVHSMTLSEAWIMILIGSAVAGAAAFRWRVIGFVPPGSDDLVRRNLKAGVWFLAMVTAISLLFMAYHDAL